MVRNLSMPPSERVVLRRVVSRGPMPDEHAPGVECPEDGGRRPRASSDHTGEVLGRDPATRICGPHSREIVLPKAFQHLAGNPVLQGIALPEGPGDDIVLECELDPPLEPGEVQALWDKLATRGPNHTMTRTREASFPSNQSTCVFVSVMDQSANNWSMF